MIREALEWMVTPSSRLARRTGLLTEAIAIAARARRCKRAWAPHLSNSKQALLESINATSEHRIALVLGSGPLLDVPLAELARLFEEVWLVDIVHPLRARWLALRFQNVRLITHDVSACLSNLPNSLAKPTRFLDETRIDWVASLNLLSQLPRAPMAWLHRSHPELSPSTIAHIGESLMRQHLLYLQSFSAPLCLITDIEQTLLDSHEQPLEHTDYAYLLEGWNMTRAWRWDIAPKGELTDGVTAHHRVGAFFR